MISGIWLSRAPALRASRTHVVSYLTTAIYVFVLRTITLRCFAARARATKSKPAATVSKPSATKSKPSATKTKPGATKSKSPFPPPIEAFQWVSLDSSSRGPPIRRLDRAPRRSGRGTGRRSISTLQAIARFLLFVNQLAPPYSHGGPADLTASPVSPRLDNAGKTTQTLAPALPCRAASRNRWRAGRSSASL